MYIFGDNDPYYTDANRVAFRLFGAYMCGFYEARKNIYRDQKMNILNGYPSACMKPHIIMTNINCLFEGDTTSEIIDKNNELEPVLYGSAGNLTVAVYDKNGKRAVMDTGLTRMLNENYLRFEGVDRYIKNATTFLAHLDN